LEVLELAGIFADKRVPEQLKWLRMTAPAYKIETVIPGVKYRVYYHGARPESLIRFWSHGGAQVAEGNQYFELTFKDQSAVTAAEVVRRMHEDPSCSICQGTSMMDSGGTDPSGCEINIPCDCEARDDEDDLP
jgi:hypothetical protein